jgi:ABC-type arginine transport system permease subunit
MDREGRMHAPDRSRGRHTGRHRLERQATLQIYLPIAGCSLLIVAAFLWVAMRSHASRVSFSNLSVAFFTLPLLVLGLLGLVLAFVLLFGVGWLLRNLPPYAETLQEWAQRGAGITRRVADLIVAPLVLAKTAGETVRGALRALALNFPFRKDD